MANVGGQAVLEGVMMRGPGNWAVAVRTPSGEIAQVSRPIDSAMARHVFFRLPIVRGVMALGESLAIGFRALAISANYAQQQEGEDGEVDTELSRGALIFAFLIAIGFAVAVFKVGPALITDQLPIRTGEYFVVVEGLIRVSMFVAYLFLISLLTGPAPRLPVPRGRTQGDQRVRGGRAARARDRAALLADPPPLRDGVPALGDGARGLRVRLLRPAHVVLADRDPDPLLPVIAGLAYELIRFAGKHQDNRVLMTLLAPGLWLQRLTTREPTLDQLEVSIRALKEVLALENVPRRAVSRGGDGVVATQRMAEVTGAAACWKAPARSARRRAARSAGSASRGRRAPRTSTAA